MSNHSYGAKGRCRVGGLKRVGVIGGLLLLAACGDGLPEECSQLVREKGALQQFIADHQAVLPITHLDTITTDLSRAEMIQQERRAYLTEGEAVIERCTIERELVKQYRQLLEDFITNEQ